MARSTTQLILDQKERVAAWVSEQLNGSREWGAYQAFGLERNGRLVAGVVISGFNGFNAFVSFAAKSPGKALFDIIHVTFVYAFQQCKLRRLTALVDVSNVKSLKLCARLGFKPEFVMKSAAKDGGDRVGLVMWADECVWIGS